MAALMSDGADRATLLYRCTYNCTRDGRGIQSGASSPAERPGRLTFLAARPPAPLGSPVWRGTGRSVWPTQHPQAAFLAAPPPGSPALRA